MSLHEIKPKVRRLFWIAAYPKSGSTWLRFFVAHLTAQETIGESLRDAALRVPVDFGQAGFDRALGIKLADLTTTEALALKPRRLEAEAQQRLTPALYLTHDAWTASPLGEPLLPAAVTAGAIHLVRDPRDIAVSYAEFFNCSLDQAIAQMADPAHIMIFNPEADSGPQLPLTLLDWSGHCRSWLAADGFPRLRLRYEDLLTNPQREFAKLARFAHLPSTIDALERAITATRFDRLKSQDAQEAYAYRGDGRSFFREGRSGGWRTALSSDQARQIERDHGPMMVHLGYL